MEPNYWMSRRFSRRTTLRSTGLVVAGLAGASLVGCGEDEEEAATGTAAPSGTTTGTGTAAPAAGAPKPGGRLVIAHNSGEPPDLDLVEGTSSANVQPLGGFYNRILKFDTQVPDGSKIVGDLATEWEIVSPTEYIFKFPSGVKWHDGEPFTAEDVVATFAKYNNSKKLRWHAVERIEATDDTTAVFHLSKPQASLLTWMCFGPMVIGPKHIWDKDEHGLEQAVVGTGPYRLDRREASVSISGIRNEDYFKPGLPYLDGYDIVFIPDVNSRIAALTSGQVDWVSRLQLPEAERAGSGSPDVVVYTSNALSCGAFGGNSSREPFNDVRVRQAISMATDRAGALAAVGEGDGVMGGLIAPGMGLSPENLLKVPGYDPSAQDANLAEAKKLLSSAGVEDGFETNFLTRASFPEYERIAVYAVDAVGKLGIQATIETLETGVLNDRRDARDFDMIAVQATGYIPDPTGTLPYWGKGTQLESLEPRVHELFDQVEASVDQEERAALAAELDQALLDDAAYVVMYWKNEHDALNKKIKNFQRAVGIHNNFVYEDVWIDA